MIEHLLLFFHSSKYALLFLGSFFEGPIVMISGGFLYSINEVSFLPMYISLVSGDFIADVVWYCVGYFGGRKVILRWGNYIHITPQIFEKLEKRFRTFETKLLIISKLTMGLGFSLATLITSGILKVSFKKYATINLLGGFLWCAIMIIVGYYLGNIYIVIPPFLKIGLVICAGLGIVIGLKLITKYLASLN